MTGLPASRAAITILGVALAGCVAVGTGTRTVVKARTDDQTVQKFLPHFATSTTADDADRVAVFRDNTEPASCVWLGRAHKLRRFAEYLQRKYGTPHPESAALSLEIRDLGRVPVLSSSLQALTSAEVIKIMTDNSLSIEQKLARKELLLAQLLNAPQAFEVRTLNRMEADCELFYYYPHVEVEFSADVLSPNIADRFSEIVLLIRLSERDVDNQIRIVNFEPKGTDIAEFSRGTFKDQSQAYIKATYGLSQTGSTQSVARTLFNPGNTTAATENTQGTSVSPSLGGEAGYTYSEAFERDLKDAIERRTVAVVEDGRTFLADFRAIRHVRVGGSYAFDLMLEVPADILPDDPKRCISQPRVREAVHADIALVGVVRHVEDVGRTGVLKRVPEAENDDVYEEVVLRTLPGQPVWTFNGELATRPRARQATNQASLDVLTNIDDARYVVLDTGGAVLGEGGGRRSRVDLVADRQQHVSVRFLDVLRTSQAGRTSTLGATPAVRSVIVGPGKGTVQVVAEYRVR